MCVCWTTWVFQFTTIEIVIRPPFKHEETRSDSQKQQDWMLAFFPLFGRHFPLCQSSNHRFKIISMLRSCLSDFPPFGWMVKTNDFHALIDLPVLTSWRKCLSLSLSLRWNQHLFIPRRSANFFHLLWNIWLSALCFFFCFLFRQNYVWIHLAAIAFPMHLHGHCVALNELGPVDIAVFRCGCTTQCMFASMLRPLDHQHK